MNKQTIASPCVRNCCLDDNNICLGCSRSLAEIVGWSSCSDAQKLAILAVANERSKTKRKNTGGEK